MRIKQTLLLFCVLLSGLSLNAQEEDQNKLLFSNALKLYLKDYQKEVDTAMEYDDYEYAQTLFDTLVHNKLQGTYLDKLDFEGYNTRLHSTEDLEKPTILLTYASWCIPNAGEIDVFNNLARTNDDLMNFIVLFWDREEIVKEQAKQFNSSVQVVYVDERKNKHMKTISLLKHALGIPLCFVLGANQEILDINRRPVNDLNLTEKESYAKNVSFIGQQLASVYLDLNIDISRLNETLARF